MKRSDLTDQQLWQRVLTDHPRAWEELVDRYKSLVYAVCSYTGLNEADAADVFQHTWIALYENRFRLQDATRISSWLVTTAKREAIRHRHRQARMQPDDCLEGEADPHPIPDEELQTMELQATLETALGRIDPACRNLLYCFFFADEDQSYEEIAESFGLSPNTLGAKRRRCLEKLKGILIGLGYLEERNDRQPPLP